jgi:tetratricopeptide (TPR) repeat protein
MKRRPTSHYTDLEIRILERRPEGYPVELTFGREQEFEQGYLSPVVLPWVPSASATNDGERLFQLLFADPQLSKAWAEIRGQNPLRRIRLRIDQRAPELHAIPWELLRELTPGFPTQTLAANASTPFSRDMAGPWRPVAPIAERPIKVLAAIANPANLADRGLPPIDTAREKQALEAAIASLSEDELELSFLEPPVTLAAIESALQEGGDHILHIVAHGVYNAKRQRAAIYLADDAGRAALIDEDAFAEMLARQGNALRLIFLASCQSATRSASDAFRGFAPRLIRAGVPAVVAMQDQVPIATARDFTGIFYRRLLRHGMVDVAGNEARSVILSADHVGSWAVPVLFSRAPDGVIVAARPEAEAHSWWQRLRQKPIIAKPLAIGGAIFSVLSVIALVLGLTGDLAAARQPGGVLHWIWPAPIIVEPMGSGFNVAVAQFVSADAQGHLSVTDESRQVGEWLFKAIERERQQLPESLSIGLHGPSQVGAIPGNDLASYNANAAQVAHQHNATILIYGVVTATPDGYAVAPEFYVSDISFGYGSEITGPDRLGNPVRFTPPLTPGEQLEINQQLNDRAKALRQIITGLGQFYLGHYDEAAAAFRQAITIDGWRDADGKEVVFLLLGAAKLRSYDQQTIAAQRNETLLQAAEIFSQTYRLNPRYARSYLGLGAVALQRARSGPPCPNSRLNADPQQLVSAQTWYEQSLAAPDRTSSAFVETKADFGLGQVQQLGYECGLPGWTQAAARQRFAQVIATYDANNQSPDLAWLAGNAHAALGRIAAKDSQWDVMASEHRKAIDVLSSMPPEAARVQLALNWSLVGYAEKQRNQLEAARDAYRQAIAIGQHVIPVADLQNWQKEIDRLGQGAP